MSRSRSTSAPPTLVISEKTEQEETTVANEDNGSFAWPPLGSSPYRNALTSSVSVSLSRDIRLDDDYFDYWCERERERERGADRASEVPPPAFTLPLPFEVGTDDGFSLWAMPPPERERERDKERELEEVGREEGLAMLPPGLLRESPVRAALPGASAARGRPSPAAHPFRPPARADNDPPYQPPSLAVAASLSLSLPADPPADATARYLTQSPASSSLAHSLAVEPPLPPPPPRQPSTVTFESRSLSLSLSYPTLLTIAPPLILSLAREQFGCRFLQAKLQEAPPAIAARSTRHVLDAVLPVFTRLAMDPFANYLCSVLLTLASPADLAQIAIATSSKITVLAVTKCGTHAAERMLVRVLEEQNKGDQALTDAAAALRLPLLTHFSSLATDAHGNHVVQKWLLSEPQVALTLLLPSLSLPQYLLPIATSRFGCCVLQFAFDVAPPSLARALRSAVISSALPLATDAFGNYVLQRALKGEASPGDRRGERDHRGGGGRGRGGSRRGRDRDRDRDRANSSLTGGPLDQGASDEVAHYFSGHLLSLARHRHGSPVLEKVLSSVSSPVQTMLCAEIAQEVLAYLEDNYGNYVVQAVLSRREKEKAGRGASGQEGGSEGGELVAEAVREVLPMLTRTPFQRRLKSKLKAML